MGLTSSLLSDMAMHLSRLLPGLLQRGSHQWNRAVSVSAAYVPETLVSPDDGRPIYLDIQVHYFKILSDRNFGV